jgi:glycosyltransferase involved in cell wall biosynthesis
MADTTPTSLVSFGDRSENSRVGKLRLHVIGRPWYVRGQRSNPLALSVLKYLCRADVVHCHQQHVLSSSLAALACRLSGRRVFVSDLGGGGWDISAYCSTDRWYHGHLHLSNYSRSVFGHTDRPWAHVIFGGVDTTRFSPGPAVERDGTVRYVGRLLPHKGINDLIAAVPPEMPAEIIGPAYDPRFRADLLGLAVGKRVRFRERCDDTALVDAYRRALCVVLPSVYRDLYGQESRVPELLGQTLLEGMACGTPAICTRVASMPEVVVDGVTGFVVPPNDPATLASRLRWLRDHPAEAEVMGEAARRHVLEKFNWPVVVQRCLDIYRA